MGRVTQYVYNDRNEQIATIQPGTSVLLTEVDGGGRIVGQTDALATCGQPRVIARRNAARSGQAAANRTRSFN